MIKNQVKLTFVLISSFFILFIFPSNSDAQISDLIRQFELVMSFDEAWELVPKLEAEIKANPKDFLKLERLVVAYFSLSMYYMEQEMSVSAYKYANYGIFFSDHAFKIRRTPAKLLAISANLHCIKAAVLINSYLRSQELFKCLEQIDKAVSIAKNNKKAGLIGQVQFLLISLVRGFNTALLPKSLKRSRIGIDDLSYVLNRLGRYASFLPNEEHQRIYFNIAKLYKNSGDEEKAEENAKKVIIIDSNTELANKAVEFLSKLR